SYSPTTTTGVLRRHLYEIHADMWIAACDQLKIVITAKCAQPAIGLYRKHHSGTRGPVNDNIPHAAFSPAAFVDAILEFVVGDDISLNVIESPRLRAIFLMLRQELNDSDIPR
ncbi:hypothetical protein C8R48DRAFT_570968, partial [Suillus tomentosus]